MPVIEALSTVEQIIIIIRLILAYGGAILGAFAVVDVLTRRADAFPAVDKQTKGTWIAITAGSAAILILGALTFMFPPQGIMWLAAMIGVLSYLAGVRGPIKRITGR